MPQHQYGIHCIPWRCFIIMKPPQDKWTFASMPWVSLIMGQLKPVLVISLVHIHFDLGRRIRPAKWSRIQQSSLPPFLDPIHLLPCPNTFCSTLPHSSPCAVLPTLASNSGLSEHGTSCLTWKPVCTPWHSSVCYCHKAIILVEYTFHCIMLP